MRAPQGCLRVWVRRLRPDLREQTDPSPTTWILPGLPEYTQASEFTSSRLPIIHLSKSCVVKVLRKLPLKVRRRSTFFHPPARRESPRGRRGAESYRSFRPCQSAPAEIFVQPSREANRPVTNALRRRLGSTVIRRREPTRSPLRLYFSKGVAGSNRRPETDERRSSITATDSEVVGRSENPTNSAGGHYTDLPPDVKRLVKVGQVR